jgi:TPP-dependent pyruvate/acetoin dehydrogenase alpha subunit
MARVLAARSILSGEGVDRVIDEVRREIEEAIRFAEEARYPDPAALLTDVYS